MNKNVTAEAGVLSSGKALKILYIQPRTSSFAGIEHVVDTISSELMETFPNLFDIDVLYMSAHRNRPKESRKYTSIDRITTGRWDMMKTLRRTIGLKDYDLVVVPQIEPTVICMVACLGLKKKFVVHLHGNPRLERSHLNAKILFLLMQRVFLSRVTAVFGTSPRQLEAFRLMFKSDRPQYWVPNPVRNFELNANAQAQRLSGKVQFVNVGRYDLQKGQDLLIDAFSELRKVRENVSLKIVGYGEGGANLREQIVRLGLEEHVTLEHYPTSPQPALEISDIYVSTSRWEGWSLAICEALRFGLPVVSTDCEFGPSDILTDPRLGRLVPLNQIDQLVSAMVYYHDNLEEERKHAAFRQEYVDRFSSSHVVTIHAQALQLSATA